jgi:putative transposase
MDAAFHGFDRACLLLIRALMRMALAIEDLRHRVPRRTRRWRGSLRRACHGWLLRHGFVDPPAFARHGRRAWNRTPERLEEKLVRIHVDQPLLGAGQLRHLCERVLAFRPGRETVRRILIRRRDLVVALDQRRRRKPRRIHVTGARHLWGVDITIIWVLGFIPVWVLGAVGYHGSRIVAFERLRWPTSAEVARVLTAAFAAHGKPLRLLSDRGPAFTSESFRRFLAESGVRQTLTRPAHPWTNGRIERVFGTFKKAVFGLVWLVSSFRQVDRFAANFKDWHNRDRPHGAWDGRTPDEVFFGRPKRIPFQPARISYFDGRLLWWKFG